MKNKNQIYEIIDINWERIFLNIWIKGDKKENIKFLLNSSKQLENVYLNDYVYEDGIYKIQINVTAVEGRTFLENDNYFLMIELDGKISKCVLSQDVAYNLDNFTRIFRYGNYNLYAYTVDFNVISSDDKNLELVLNSYFMEINKKWETRKLVKEAQTFFGKLRNLKLRCVIVLLNILYKILRFFNKFTGKNILIMSETHNYIWGNLKSINDTLKKRGLDKEFNISYNFRVAVGQNQSSLSWLKLVFKIAKQDFIFVDNYVPIFNYLNLDKKTHLIQVWHAGAGFKAVGYCRFGKKGSPFPTMSCHKKYTECPTGSKELIHVFEEVFGIEKSAFLPIGMPRLDGYLDAKVIKDFKKDFYEKNPKLKGKKIILFAPTYRGVGQKDAYYDYSKIDLKQIYDYCGKDKVFVVKLHPFINEKLQIPEEFKDRIFDFSFFKNINDLFYVTDILITDYSSNFYEYSLMRRPMIFYTYDRSLYELTRGVYRSIKDNAPGKVCDTFDELMNSLKNEDYEFYKVEKFVKECFADFEGNASNRIIDDILLKNRRF